MVASPLTGLASAMGGLIGGLARQLQQMADQGLVGGDAPRPRRRTRGRGGPPPAEPRHPPRPAAAEPAPRPTAPTTETQED